MPVDFDAETSRVFGACDERLGDTLTVTPKSGGAITIKGHVDYGDRLADFGETGAVIQDITVDYAMSKVPGEPGKGWRIALPRLSGRIFEPIAVRRDSSGKRWVFGVKEAPSD